jgi:serine phosphatase RsbU (regulator of sigma subunit)
MPILCAVIIGSSISGVFAYQVASDLVIKAYMEDGFRSATNLRDSVDMVLYNARRDLAALAVSPSVNYLLTGVDGVSELVEDYIKTIVEEYDLYSSIVVLNTDGIVVASTCSSTGENRSDRDDFRVSINGEPYISQIESSRQTGHDVVLISGAVYDKSGDTIIGVATIAILIEEFNNRFIAPVSLLSNQGYAKVVTVDGTVIGHRREEEIGRKILDDAQSNLSRADDEDLLMVRFEITRHESPFMAFAVRCSYADWFAIVACPISQFYNETDKLARMTALIVASSTILIALIILLAVGGVTKALSTTVRYAGAVSHGELDTPLSVIRDDEVGVLADSLRDMVDKLKNMINVAEEKTAEAENAKDIILSGITYASKIQSSLLPKPELLAETFNDYSVIWNPRDIVGGDLYWMKHFDDGAVLCVCDCTGHGTPGALLTMLVASALESVVKTNNYKDTADIIWSLEKRLVHLLQVQTHRGTGAKIEDIHDGCDIAVLYIDKSADVCVSAGNTHVFVCDGEQVNQIKGQRIFVGEGNIQSKDEIITVKIPANPDNKFYVASDGLYDQIGGEAGVPFGYNRFKRLIFENHALPQSDISNIIWQDFENYRGEQPRRDDFQLISFKP